MARERSGDLRGPGITPQPVSRTRCRLLSPGGPMDATQPSIGTARLGLPKRYIFFRTRHTANFCPGLARILFPILSPLTYFFLAFPPRSPSSAWLHGYGRRLFAIPCNNAYVPLTDAISKSLSSKSTTLLCGRSQRRSSLGPPHSK